MENKYKVKDWVYSVLLGMALEVVKDNKDPKLEELFTCTISAVNRWPKVYSRMASGVEVFKSLDLRDRMQKRLDALREHYRIK